MKVLTSLLRCLPNSRAVLGLIVLATVAGCGGGSGSEFVASNPPPPPPPPVVIPVVGTMTLLAGTVGGAGSNDGTPGRFNRPAGLATDTNGNVYVADTANHTIRKISAAGVFTLAGKAGVTGSTDGSGAAALFKTPVAVAVDLAGNVYVADQGNNVIRKINPAGFVTVLAGSVGSAGNVDGAGAAARFSVLIGIAVDINGTVFVAEPNQVRKNTPEGIVTTLATGFGGLSALVPDRIGNVFVVDSDASVIRKITASGAVSLFAGSTVTTNGVAPFGFADGAPGVARFDHPASIAANDDGKLYVLDNGRIRRLGPDGVVDSLPINKPDGTRYVFPGNDGRPGLAIAADGSFFVSAPSENFIRKVTVNLSVIDIAGASLASGNADGVGMAARFSGPGDVAVDAGGNIIVVDALNNAIRKITPSGVVTTVASNVREGATNLFGLNPNSAALLGLAIDRTGAIFVADPYFHLIRRIGTDGSKIIVAGSSWPDGVYSGGFFPQLSGRSQPIGVAIDSTGTLFVPDGAIVRKIATGGVDTILACTNLPTCVAAGKLVEAITVDKADNIYIAQAGLIFKISSAGLSSTLAGGSAVKFNDGSGSNASFGFVRALTTDAAGNVFVADTTNNAVRKITPSGVVTTIAGVLGAVGVNVGTLPASLNAPAGIAVDTTGVLYVSSENAVLKINP